MKNDGVWSKGHFSLYPTILALLFTTTLLLTTFIMAAPTSSTNIALDHVTLLLPSPSCDNSFKSVSYPLNARGGSSGCFKWSTAHTHLISVTPSTDKAHQCSVVTNRGILHGTTQAIITVLGDSSSQNGQNINNNNNSSNNGSNNTDKQLQSNTNSSTRQSALVWVEDLKVNSERANCEVYLDVIKSLFVKTSTKRINLGDKELFSLQAYDEHDDVFSTLEGLIFDWEFTVGISPTASSDQQQKIVGGAGGNKGKLNQNDNKITANSTTDDKWLSIIDSKLTSLSTSYPQMIARPLSLITTRDVDITDLRIQMAQKDLGSDTLLLTGHNPGRTKFRAFYTCQKKSTMGSSPDNRIMAPVDIVVAEPLMLMPPLLRICPASNYNFNLFSRYTKANSAQQQQVLADGSHLVQLPQGHLMWVSDNNAMVVEDVRLGKINILPQNINNNIISAQLSVIDTALNETAATSSILITQPHSAKVLMYYIDETFEKMLDQGMVMNNSINNKVNSQHTSTLHQQYLNLYQKSFISTPTLTSLPLETPLNGVNRGQEFQSGLQVTGNVDYEEYTGLFDSFDSFSTNFAPAKKSQISPQTQAKLTQFHLQPQCDGVFHLSPGVKYVSRLVLLGKNNKPIDICSTTTTLIYHSTPHNSAQTKEVIKKMENKIDLIVDDYGHFVINTPQQGQVNIPQPDTNGIIYGTIVVTLNGGIVIDTIPLQIDPQMMIKADFSSQQQQQKQQQTDLFYNNQQQFFLLPTLQNQCPYQFNAVGGSGQYTWSNMVQNKQPNQKNQFLTILEQQSNGFKNGSKLQFHSTTNAGSTIINLHDVCNPLSRAQVKIETSPIGQICLSPRSQELFLTEPQTATTTNDNTNPDYAQLQYFLTDITGSRRFSTTQCISLTTTVTPLGTPSQKVITAVTPSPQYLTNCDPQSLDNQSQRSLPLPPMLLPPNNTVAKINNKLPHIDSQSCYSYGIIPSTPGIATIDVTVNDPAYLINKTPQQQQQGKNIQNVAKMVKSTTTFAVYKKPQISSYLTPFNSLISTMTPSIKYNDVKIGEFDNGVIYAVYGQPLTILVSNGQSLFPSYPTIPSPSPMCVVPNSRVVDYSKNNNNGFGGITTPAWEWGMQLQQQQQANSKLTPQQLLSQQLKIDTLPMTYPNNVFPSFNITCIPPTKQQQQKDENGYLLNFSSFNHPTKDHQYPHITSTTKSIVCTEALCPKQRHFSVMIGTSAVVPIDTGFKYKNGLKYTVLDEKIVKIDSTGNKSAGELTITGLQIGITVIIIDTVIDNQLQPHMRTFISVQVQPSNLAIAGNQSLLLGTSSTYTLNTKTTKNSQTPINLEQVDVEWSLYEKLDGKGSPIDNTLSLAPLSTLPLLTITDEKSINNKKSSLQYQVNGLSTRFLTTKQTKPGNYDIYAHISTTYPALSDKTKSFLQSVLLQNGNNNNSKSTQGLFDNLSLCSQQLDQSLLGAILNNEQFVMSHVQKHTITVVSQLELLTPSTIRLIPTSSYEIVTQWAQTPFKNNVQDVVPMVQFVDTNNNQDQKKNFMIKKSDLTKEQAQLNIAKAMLTTPSTPISTIIKVTTPEHINNPDLSIDVHVSTPSTLDLIPQRAVNNNNKATTSSLPSLLEDPTLPAQSLLTSTMNTDANQYQLGLTALSNIPLCPHDALGKNITPYNDVNYDLIFRDEAGNTFTSLILPALQQQQQQQQQKKSTKQGHIMITVDKTELVQIELININDGFDFTGGMTTTTSKKQSNAILMDSASLAKINFIPLKSLSTDQTITIAITAQIDNVVEQLPPLYLRLTVGSVEYCSNNTQNNSKIATTTTTTTNNNNNNNITPAPHEYALRLTIPLSQQFVDENGSALLNKSQKKFVDEKMIFEENSPLYTNLISTFETSIYSLVANATQEAIKAHALDLFDLNHPSNGNATSHNLVETVTFNIPHISLYTKHIDLVLKMALVDVFFISTAPTTTTTASSTHHPHQWNKNSNVNISSDRLDIVITDVAQRLGDHFKMVSVYNHILQEYTQDNMNNNNQIQTFNSQQQKRQQVTSTTPITTSPSHTTINKYNPWLRHVIMKKGPKLTQIEQNVMKLINNFNLEQTLSIDLFDATPLLKLLLAQNLMESIASAQKQQYNTINVEITATPIITNLLTSVDDPQYLIDLSYDHISSDQKLGQAKAKQQFKPKVLPSTSKVIKNDYLRYSYTVSLVPDIYDIYPVIDINGKSTLFNEKRAAFGPKRSLTPIISQLFPFFTPQTHISTQITQSSYILSCFLSESQQDITTTAQQLTLWSSSLLPQQQQKANKKQSHPNLSTSLLAAIPSESTFFPASFTLGLDLLTDKKGHISQKFDQHFDFLTSLQAKPITNCNSLLSALATSYRHTPYYPETTFWDVSHQYILALGQNVQNFYKTSATITPTVTSLPSTTTTIPTSTHPQLNAIAQDRDDGKLIGIGAATIVDSQVNNNNQGMGMITTILYAAVIALVAGGVIVFMNVRAQPPPPPLPQSSTQPQQTQQAPPQQSHLAARIVSPRISRPGLHTQTPHTRSYYNYGEQ